MMHLKVLLPSEVLVDQKVKKIVAEAENGLFCLLPRHIDFVTALTPGLLSFVADDDQKEEYLAIDIGILVKCGDQVLVSSQNAAIGPDLGALKAMIEERFSAVDDHEKVSRAALARLEADLVRRFVELGQAGYA
jgi:F-type H+-transporting ATPase subunit epsilon